MSAEHFLRCVSDAYTAVRDEQGKLLGCIPLLTADVPAVPAPGSDPFETRIAAVRCILVKRNQDPAKLPGFIPWGGK